MDGILQDSDVNRKGSLFETLSKEIAEAEGVEAVFRLNAYMNLVEKHRERGFELRKMLLESAREKLPRSGFNQVMYGVLASTGEDSLHLVAQFFRNKLNEEEYAEVIYRFALDKIRSPDKLLRLLESVVAHHPREELINDILSEVISMCRKGNADDFLDPDIGDDEPDVFTRIVSTALLKLNSRHLQIRFIIDAFSQLDVKDRYRLSLIVYNVLGDWKWALELCEMSMAQAPGIQDDVAERIFIKWKLYALLDHPAGRDVPEVKNYMDIIGNADPEHLELYMRMRVIDSVFKKGKGNI